jgi:putative transposase
VLVIKLQESAEGFIQTIQQECLDHFVVLGERHLNHLVREFVQHYHTERPHQGKGNAPLVGRPAGTESGGIVVRDRLGGLLKHYERAA